MKRPFHNNCINIHKLRRCPVCASVEPELPTTTRFTPPASTRWILSSAPASPTSTDRRTPFAALGPRTARLTTSPRRAGGIVNCRASRKPPPSSSAAARNPAFSALAIILAPTGFRAGPLGLRHRRNGTRAARCRASCRRPGASNVPGRGENLARSAHQPRGIRIAPYGIRGASAVRVSQGRVQLHHEFRTGFPMQLLRLA